MSDRPIVGCDLFSGAGGTSPGLAQACAAAGRTLFEILDDGTLVIHFAETAFTPSQLQDIYERVKNKAINSLTAKK